MKPNFILQKSTNTCSDLVYLQTMCLCVFFKTNMQGNLACQTSFSLALFGNFFLHNTNKDANIVQKLFILLPSSITNIDIY